MQAFSNANIKDNLCGGCDCTGFAPALAYTYNEGTGAIVVTDATVYPTGDYRKVIHVSVHDGVNTPVKGSMTSGDVDNAITLDASGLDDSDGLKLLATIVTNEGCISDGHAWNIGAAGNFGKWDKDYDSHAVGAVAGS